MTAKKWPPYIDNRFLVLSMAKEEFSFLENIQRVFNITDEDLREALRQEARAGDFSRARWVEWHMRLEIDPPLPFPQLVQNE